MQSWIDKEVNALVYPLIVLRADIYRDGGTIGVAIEDATGVEKEFCLDRRIKSPTHGALIWGAFYPRNGNGQMVEKGSAAELTIVELIRKIISQEFSGEEQKELTGAYGKRKLNDKERKAALCLSLAAWIVSDSE